MRTVTLRAIALDKIDVDRSETALKRISNDKAAPGEDEEGGGAQAGV